MSAAGAVAPRPLVDRATAGVSAWNLVSRLTGFVRVVVMGAAIGTTYLGNTYQSANLVSNVLFELMAGGLLASVLVPPLVARLDAGDEAGARRLAGAALGAVLAVLAVVVVVAMAAARPLMRLLTLAVDDPSVRADEVELGSFFLLFFLPQVLLYAVGAVATAVLHARRRFAAAAAAPVANNVVVIATMAAFWALRSGAEPSLDLTTGQAVVLAGGTTLGVLAMAAVPVVALGRAGLVVVPRDPRTEPIGALARDGLWAGGHLGLHHLLVAVTVVFANRVEGGVVAYQIAFTCFLLPHALVANPLATTSYPDLASRWLQGDRAGFHAELDRVLRALTLGLVPATLLAAAGGWLVVPRVEFGAVDESGATLIGHTLVAYAAGLLGYGALLVLTKASYAAGDVRLPTIVNAAVLAVAVAGMAVASSTVDGHAAVWSLGLAHSLAVGAGAAALLVALRARTAVSHP